MKKFLLLSALSLSLTSCRIAKLAMDKKNHRTVVIKDMWSPVDAYILGTYPIKDHKAYAIGVQEIGSDSIIYARDYDGFINENYQIGDTIKVILFVQ